MVVIYQKGSTPLLPNRIHEAQQILEAIPTKYVFITGSFLYSKTYNDIDVFVITRSKKEFSHPNPKVTITTIDFNDLHSLQYHSMALQCVAKTILPTKLPKLTIATFWQSITNCVITFLSEPEFAKKDIKTFFLYATFLQSKTILDSYELTQISKMHASKKSFFSYLMEQVPEIFRKNCSKSYIQRFFYTESGFRQELNYESSTENFFKTLSLDIIYFVKNGRHKSIQNKYYELI